MHGFDPLFTQQPASCFFSSWWVKSGRKWFISLKVLMSLACKCSYIFLRCCNLCCIYFFLKSLFIYFQRGEGREKERGRNISVWLPPERRPPGTWPARFVILSRFIPAEFHLESLPC